MIRSAKPLILALALIDSGPVGRPSSAAPQEEPPRNGAAEDPEAAPDIKTAGTAAAEELEAFLKSWADKSSSRDRLELHFRQEKSLKFMRRALSSRGRIRLAGKRLLCEVHNDRGELESALLVDGDVLKIYYPRLAILEIYELGSAPGAAAAFPVFGSEVEALKRDYEMVLKQRRAKDGAVWNWLQLKPRSSRAPIASMTLTFKNGEIREVQQVDQKGDQVLLRIDKTIAGAKIRPEELKIQVPAGTRELRPLAGKESGAAKK
jgi:hypothetical protein